MIIMKNNIQNKINNFLKIANLYKYSDDQKEENIINNFKLNMLKPWLINILKTNYSKILKPDYIEIKLIPSSQYNQITLIFYYGNETYHQGNSDVARNIEFELLTKVKNDIESNSSYKFIFNKNFNVNKFGSLLINKEELSFLGQNASGRKVRQNLD